MSTIYKCPRCGKGNLDVRLLLCAQCAQEEPLHYKENIDLLSRMMPGLRKKHQKDEKLRNEQNKVSNII